MRTHLSASIGVALKRASKATRKALNDKDWMIREAAEHEIVELILEGLQGFEIAEKAAEIPNRYPGRNETFGNTPD